MKIRVLVAMTMTLVVVIAVATGGGIAYAHSSRFADAAASLRATWATDEKQGVPATSIRPLEDRLTAAAPPSQWWSAQWLNSDHTQLISGLREQTDAIWESTLVARRQDAQEVIDQWTAFAGQQSTWVGADAMNAAAKWPAQLSGAATPAAVDALAASWTAFIDQQRTAVRAAQAKKLNDELAADGGPQAVLTTATNLEKAAVSANLDDQGVGALAAELQQELTAGADGTETAGKLVTAVNALQALVNLNNQVGAQMRPLLYAADQAAAEQTPNGNAFAAQYGAVAAAYRAARTSDTLTAAAQQAQTLQAQINAELGANTCGHPVGPGKVITVNLTLQEMIFYQDGCVIHANPTTTGRPALPTPTGTFHVFYKTSPFHMISPWPMGSPYYYYPTWVSQVMEFDSGGYFIHDAYWEPVGDYGPGSQYNLGAASHGCIHIPTPDMEWAYPWTPVGTPVIISA